MKGYVCVYRHIIPARRYRLRTEQAADGNPLLRRYLDQYDNAGCFYDWGDDPSFFSATDLLDDAAHASWGVCRREVRSRVASGDYVVFICARQSPSGVWRYYYVGVATVAEPLTRQQIWTDESYSEYRDFLNILSRPGPDGALEQHEYVHKWHRDWERRSDAPYWLFDPGRSRFNLRSPVHIASYNHPAGGIERWHSSDERVRDLRSRLLRGARASRGLAPRIASVRTPR